MVLMRHWWGELQGASWLFPGRVPWQIYVGPIHNGIWTLLWLLSAAYVVLRLIPPRPRWSDLMRQPGILFLVLMSAIAILILCLAYAVPVVGTGQTWAMIGSGLALALLWTVASRRQRSRTEPGWIESLGRAVAIGWIFTITLNDPLLFLAILLS
jgi:hypothetical protein